MKLITAVVCITCDEVFDSALYRVCPSCANADFKKISDMIGVATICNEKDGKKCK
jgi:predicted  nucleic acid-binding Zn-ribbon protein